MSTNPSRIIISILLFVLIFLGLFPGRLRAIEDIDWNLLTLDGIRLKESAESVKTSLTSRDQSFEELKIRKNQDYSAIRVLADPNLYIKFSRGQAVQIGGAENLALGERTVLSIVDKPKSIIEQFGQPNKVIESNYVLYEYRRGELILRFSLTLDETEILRIGIETDDSLQTDAGS